MTTKCEKTENTRVVLTFAVLHAQPHDQRGDEAQAAHDAHHDAHNGTHAQLQVVLVVVAAVVGARHGDGTGGATCCVKRGKSMHCTYQSREIVAEKRHGESKVLKHEAISLNTSQHSVAKPHKIKNKKISPSIAVAPL